MINAAAYRPFEAERRVFVIEAADAMADESQNALLKTLEEPASFVHLILISAEPGALLETVRSRCQSIRFAPLGDEAVEEGWTSSDSARARSSAAPPPGSRVATPTAPPSCSLPGAASFALRRRRASTERFVARLGEAPWTGLLEAAEAAGSRAREEAEERRVSRRPRMHRPPALAGARRRKARAGSRGGRGPRRSTWAWR